MDKSLFTYRGIKPVLVGLTFITVIQSIMIIIQAYFLADSISSLFGGDLFHNVIKKLVFFFLALVFRQVLVFMKKKIAYRFATDTSVHVRESVLKKLFQLGPRWIKKEGSGQTVTLIMEGTIKFQRYLELFLPKLVNIAIIPGAVCLFVFFENIRSAVILIVAVPILMIFMILLGLAARDKANRQYESYQMLSNHFVDSLRGLDTLRYLGLSRKHIEAIRFVSERYRKATMATLRIAFLSTFALDFFTMLSVAMVAVFLGIGLINGTMELKTALTILILAPEYFLPIREVGADYHATLDGKDAGKKFQEILQIEVTQKQGTFPALQSEPNISVKDLSIQFAENNQNGLEHINFSISGMKKIGIIGASGAGKSTLVDVLSGFLAPTEGEFLINGEKFETLSQEEWQKQLTYIPQHPYIFSDTVFNNIRFYQPTATDKEVEAAAMAAGLTEVIHELPDGYRTLVGEGGRNLSGGQEQRMALARAFLGNRPILLLDEPTAHLDIETEYELKEAMLQLFNGKLVFFATHRLHWMLEMDQILVLDHGKLVETGTHEQLMALQGFYYRLFHSQVEGLS
ncbi:thiol reductant ABC exporter subunit CydD [Neobacillus massiliamazoniensis]|uniref:ABC transporter ATP-binding protein n=1 Tax=Neobacillus massiliamazoniensis TaxID=1499688 RepID=A0A0U1NWX7_9BACI|nr:thiol reductant ABC exporter subunit CydD [Neobacillus massiliamazoniensis]CRK82514.1 ABC transporter ATP-binding protein [Neobacillus massiliamazoniensis]